MKKEAALFVVSTGFLIYFIAPIGDEEQTPPVQAEKVQKPAPVEDDEEESEDDDDDGWYDDEDFEEESFDSYDATDGDEEEYSEEEDTAVDSVRGAVDYTAQESKMNDQNNGRSSNAKGKPGSKANPIVLNTGTSTRTE